MSPAHATRAVSHGGEHERRWLVLLAVAAFVAVVAVVAGTRAAPTTVAALATPSSLVSPPDAESSAWYCTGQTTGSGTAAQGFLVLSNTTTHAVRAEISTVTDGGATVRTAVLVPALGVLAPSLPVASSGTWEADTVTLSGGGVAVSQAVHGSGGWSVAPCQSSTSANWYFPDGSTAGSNGLSIVLLNPTSSPVVVDLAFITPTGEVQPINYQGVVLGPGAVLSEDVASEVQNASQVSTVVTARTGRVVAAEVQAYTGPSAGLSVVPGLAQVERRWAIPQAEEVSGGSSEIDVFNPGTLPETITVHLRLASGPLAPLVDTVAPNSTWSLATNTQTRIPVGAAYSAEVDASGGSGVVVSRSVAAPGSATSPQAGLATALDDLTSTTPAKEWIVPPPGTAASLPVTGAAPSSLALLNVTSAPETVHAYAAGPGRRLLVSGTLEPGASEIVAGSTLSSAGLEPIVVQATGALAVSEDLAPSGRMGVVTMPGIPLAAALGL